jgi:hypothetical protein
VRSVTLATAGSRGWNTHSDVESTEGCGGKLSSVLVLSGMVVGPRSPV